MAVIVIAAMVLATTTPLFVDARPDGMSLRARDIGTGWHDNLQFSHNCTANNTFYSNVTSAEFIILSNMTSIIVSELNFYNSTEAILERFNNDRIWSMRFPNTFEDVDIGEMGYIYAYGIYTTVTTLVVFDNQGFYANRSNVVTLEFIEGKVFSSITVLIKGVDTPTQPWIWDFILDIGAKQLQKIDRYSS
jgi:hypothetical protein